MPNGSAGLVLTFIQPHSLAAKSGLETDDVIIQFEDFVIQMNQVSAQSIITSISIVLLEC
jgi:hypothetical protein